ncbi:MAG: endonuclease [Phycisphaerales bacterium]|nr:endonuclease [Planctomycetota bacterium]MCH8509065.1 endonuclease [Phycisphaerales bacterium]
MPRPACTLATGMFATALLLTTASADEGPYAPPPNYYNSVTGTGEVLREQLRAAMSAGHIQRQYGEFRFAAAITDADPDVPGNILLIFNRASVPATWDQGGTWNREHVWPQSRQPGTANNNTRGNLGDHHALRPINPSINSSRGNKPFGFAETTGQFGSLGSYWFPGDDDKGDAARALFYSDVRWGAELGLSLVNTFPVGFQMGELASMIAWHYLDPPDEFEIRRNHAVFSPAMNPLYFTNNRNAFVDLPEVVWSLYVDQANDSTLFVGDAPEADGSSSVSVTLNTLTGTALGQIPVTLNKSGQAGTYYRVTTTSGVESSITGRHNAFPIGDTDTTRTLLLTPAPGATDQSGLFAEQVIISNLDLTTQAGPGMGANDADDTILVELAVYDPAVASFDQNETLDELLLDLGPIEPGSGDAVTAFDFFNIAPGPTAAPMDIELITATGDTGALSVAFDPVAALPAGTGETFFATLSDAEIGEFEAVYTFRAFNDRALFTQPGEGTDLILRLSGAVASACIPDFAEPFGVLNFFDVAAFLALYAKEDPRADINGDGVFNFFDVSEYMALYNAGCP